MSTNAASAAAGLAEAKPKRIELEAVIGFNGHIPEGLVLHPDGIHILYPLGTTVVVKNTLENKQVFLQGHTDRVTCIAVSDDGAFAASGQTTALGFKSPVIVWDLKAAFESEDDPENESNMLEEPENSPLAIYKLMLHKGGVQAVDFSICNNYLATLGGQHDNSIVIWDLNDGQAICGSPAASHQALTLKWARTRSDMLMTAGHYNIRRWQFDHDRRKVLPTDMAVGALKRIVNCLVIDDTDTLAWCGTHSGDLLEINITHGRFVRASKNRFSQGILSVAYVPMRPYDLIICGNGDGSLVCISTQALQVVKAVQLLGRVTSVALNSMRDEALIGTSDGNRYLMDVEEFQPELRGTSHADRINDVIFPKYSSELFLTCSKRDVRLWNANTRMELLRIQVPNLECMCATILEDGSSIVTGWDDGKIRCFSPESGKLKFVITDAHAECVTSIAATQDCTRLLSGGKDGRVRVWNIAGSTQIMEASFKEHKRSVTNIAVSKDDDEFVTSSEDGSCIVWNLRRGVRANALFASTMFRAALYHPDESQLLTAGSDRKLSYWDTTDCTAIRVIDGSTEEIMSIDIDHDGLMFASGGRDKLLKLWLYDEGINIGVGRGHSGAITRLRISPDKTKIVSVGEEGAIFVWGLPHPSTLDLKSFGVDLNALGIDS